ncbi:MAG: hypothetical protein GY940_41090, partial [bacterium]|nr:hypothetical protein [bacterium]
MEQIRNMVLTRQLFSVIILVLSLQFPAWALDPGKPLEHYLENRWDTGKGLPSNIVNTIAQTPDGYLWIGTNKGLVRFDGIDFSMIPLTPEQKMTDAGKIVTAGDIIFMDTDRTGTLWIATVAGLSSYRYDTGKFTTLTGQDGLANGDIRHFRVDMKGDLWVGFKSSYLYHLSKADGKITPFNQSHGLEDKRINFILEDHSGDLLIASNEKGIYKFRDDKFIHFPVNGLNNIRIDRLYETKDRTLWIGTVNGLFMKKDDWVQQYTAAGHGLSHGSIIGITKDREKNLWVISRKGVNRIQQGPGNTIQIDSLLTSYEIVCHFIDRDDNLWVGTLDSGLIRVTNGTFFSHPPLEAQKPDLIYSMYEDVNEDSNGNEAIWIGSVEGKLYRIRGDRLIETVQPQGLSKGITAITSDSDGNLWIGTIDAGVLVLQNNKKNNSITRYTTKDGLADNSVTSVFKDRQGNLWFGTFDGISVYRYKERRFQSFKARDGLSAKQAYNVYEDTGGNIWAGTEKGITFFKDGILDKKHVRLYLEGHSINCIHEDPGNAPGKPLTFWIATGSNGFKRLTINPRDVSLVSVISYTTAEGMSTDSLDQVLEDSRGNFWITGNAGILQVNKTDLNRYARDKTTTIHCISYGISDGLKSIQFTNASSRHSAIKTRDGQLWFITNEGISIVDPKRIHANKTPPSAIIGEVSFNRQSQPLYRSSYQFKGTVDVDIRFTAPTSLSPEKLKFKYRLENHDADHILLPPGEERVAHYPALEPGDYTFKV